MKALFAFTHSYFWLPLDPVARRLCERGHQVRVLFDQKFDEKYRDQHAIEFANAPYPTGWITARSDRWRRPLLSLRELINYAAYWKVRQPTSPMLVERWREYLPRVLQFLTRRRLVNRLLSTNCVWKTLRRLEQLAPPDAQIVHELRTFRPDVVIAGSTILPHSTEVEYLKAAQALGIATAIVVPSWDNLTTKGTFHVIPDLVLVWNQRQVREAVELHFVPEDRVRCTGAVRYDPWFAMQPSLARRDFCRQVGLDLARPFFVYLCSSKFIAGDETSLVRQFAEETTRDGRAQVVIRPHPLNIAIWKACPLPVDTAVWPAEMPMNPALINQGMYDTLFHSAGAVGVNTSAFIEAAILDKPCIAITADQYSGTQSDIPHFQHLVEAGFLEMPRDAREAASVIGGLLRGDDRKHALRRRFVREFVRPQGIDVPSTTIVGKLLEELVLRKAGAPQGSRRVA